VKILRIVPSLDPKQGGVAEAVRLSAITKYPIKITIDVACFDEPTSDWVKNENNFQIFALGKGKSAYAFHLKYLTWLSQNVKNYDVVIIDGLWMFHVWGGYICRMKNVPYFVYSHGMLDPYFNQDRLKYLKKLPFWFLVERNVLQLARSVIYTCEEEKILAQNSFPLFKAKSSIVSLGIKTPTEKKEVLTNAFLDEYPQFINKKFGLFLSRIHPKKGIDLLIKAIAELDDELPSEFIIAIAGTGDDEYIQNLQNLAETLNITKRFQWLGMISGNVKWGAFSAAGFFILPSHQENFGIVVAEALAVGTPALISDKVNIWREIKEMNAGLVADDTLEGTKELIQAWLNFSDEQKQTIQKNTVICFEQNFDVAQAAKNIIGVLNKHTRVKDE
jgi:glycosyltransferase involved in cell wall biosynthesis